MRQKQLQSDRIASQIFQLAWRGPSESARSGHIVPLRRRASRTRLQDPGICWESTKLRDCDANLSLGVCRNGVLSAVAFGAGVRNSMYIYQVSGI
jgi:hypothetical protein